MAVNPPTNNRSWEDAILYLSVMAFLTVVAVFLWESNSQLEESLLSDHIIANPPALDQDVPYLSAQLNMAHFRYRQATFALYSKSVRRNAGFLVGAIIVSLGGIFVVRRLEVATNISGAVRNQFAAQLVTSSPGIVMAFLGTVILGIALLAQERVYVLDYGLEREQATTTDTAAYATAARNDFFESFSNREEDN